MTALDKNSFQSAFCLECVSKTLAAAAEVKLVYTAADEGTSTPESRTLTVTDKSTFTDSDTFKAMNVQVFYDEGGQRKIAEKQITSAGGNVTFDFLSADISEGYGVNITAVSTKGQTANGGVKMPPFDATLNAGHFAYGSRPVVTESYS